MPQQWLPLLLSFYLFEYFHSYPSALPRQERPNEGYCKFLPPKPLAIKCIVINRRWHDIYFFGRLFAWFLDLKNPRFVTGYSGPEVDMARRDAFVDERTVDVHIGRLRKALIRGNERDPIRTVRSAGYVFGDS